jgi:hypothetical protein
MNEKSENIRYEKRDVKSVMIIAIAVVIVAVLTVIIIVLNDYFIAEKEEMIFNVVLKPESSEIRDLRAHETEVLTTYKLIDPVRGVYRIPIDRAMQLLAEEHFQDRLKDR